MPDLTVDADLLVEAGGTDRQLSVDDFKAPATGAASQTTAAAILAALTDGDEATSLAALVAIRAAVEDLASDDDGISREGTALSILAKLGSVTLDAATLAALETIQVGNLPADPATQTTLAALLAELAQKLEPGDLAGLATTVAVDGVRDRLPVALDTDGALKVADVFTGGEALPDQTGNGTARTFTFASPVDLVWVRSEVAARADPFGGVPTAAQGIPCAADEPNPMTVRTATVKVLAASGTISVWGYRG